MMIITLLLVVCLGLMFTTAYYMDKYNVLSRDLEKSVLDQYVVSKHNDYTDYQNGWNQATNNVLFTLNRLKRGKRYE